ncbi:MAG: hypothetical protein RLZZ301_759 [Bacteroidota bacterium]|jgi:hypothetical protein
MILYNVTVSVDTRIEHEWLAWMRQVHIPEVMQTGCFLECRVSRIHGEEEGGSSYSFMYLAPNQAALDTYQQQHAPALQKDHAQRYQGHFAAFRTELTVIEEFKA